jgi:hypothetical protein
MAYEYLIPISTTAQSATFTGATSAITCTLNLSADTQLGPVPLSGTVLLTPMSLAFTAGKSSTTPTLTATSTGISLTIPSNRGNTVVYGYIASSYLTPTSGLSATVKFNDPNFATTSLVVSGNSSNAIILSGAGFSVIDNPMIVLQSGAYNLVFNGLSSSNVYFRTVGRQVRLRQGYEA